MNLISKILYFIIWIALGIGIGGSFVDLTNSLRGVAIHAHQHGPLSYKLYTEQLTGEK